MSEKHFKAFMVAVLLAFSLTISAAPLVAPTVVMAAECDSTAGGCG
jgi:hypothetical protein